MKVIMNIGVKQVSTVFVIIRIAPEEDINKNNNINMYALYSDKVSVHGKYYSDYYRKKFQKRFKRRVF